MQWDVVISAIAGLAGVALGVVLTGRSADRQAEVARRQHAAERAQDAAADFLAAVRIARRWAMYSAPDGDMLLAGVKFAAIPGRDAHDATIDEAYARVLVTTASQAVRQETADLARLLNQLFDARVEHGRGNIPASTVRDFRVAELAYATLVRVEVRASS